MKIALHIPRFALALPLCLSACTFDGSAPNLGNSDGGPPIDASRFDAGHDADLPQGVGVHLLLTEVKTTDPGTEFVEIYNPTQESISLGDYYLSDDRSYAFLPGFFGAGPRPSLGTSDFIARFPDGASIASGAVQVIAIKPEDFAARVGMAPTYSIRSTSGEPEMRPAFDASIGNFTTLTDGGETITLFYWDGQSDLVLDIDIVIAGASTSADNGLANKSDRDVDGPDNGSATSAYRQEIATMGNMAQPLDDTQSYQRTAPELGAEVQDTASNGRLGHDETSEDTASTWSVGEITPGTVSGI